MLFPAALHGGAVDFLVPGVGVQKHLFLLGVRAEVGLLRHRATARF